MKDNNGETAYSYLMMRAEDDRETLKNCPNGWRLMKRQLRQ